MQNWSTILFIIIITIGIGFLQLYFFAARKFNIIDKPNNRSSHITPTLRGAGIIFPIFFLIGINFSNWLLFISVFTIGLVSFWDDIKPQKPMFRMGIQLLMVGLLIFSSFQQNFSEINITSALIFIISLIVITGFINTFNFMDGINGITVLYALVGIISLYLFQRGYFYEIWSKEYQNALFLLIPASLAFGFYNLRKKAVCFSGDVGAVSIALILGYGVLQLCLHFNSPIYILLFGVYGLDSVATIVLRIIRKEQIFKPHRSHFYQFLANEKKWPHVLVSIIYAATQLGLNWVVFNSSLTYALIAFTILTLAYILLRLRLEGTKKLFSTSND